MRRSSAQAPLVPASQPIDRDVPTDKKEEQACVGRGTLHACSQTPCRAGGDRRYEVRGRRISDLFDTRGAGSNATSHVAIAARPLVPLRRTYVVTAYYGTESRPRHFRQKKRRKIRGPSAVFLWKFASAFAPIFSFCSLRRATTARPQHCHFAKRTSALGDVGCLEVQDTLVFAGQHEIADPQ